MQPFQTPAAPGSGVPALDLQSLMGNLPGMAGLSPLLQQYQQLTQGVNQEKNSRQGLAEQSYGNLNQVANNLFNPLRTQLTNKLNNPGLAQATLLRMRNRARGTGAADTSAVLRSTRDLAARLGVRGAAGGALQLGAQNQVAAGTARNLLDIDINAESERLTDFTRTMSQATSFANQEFAQRQSLNRDYVNTLTSYDPQVPDISNLLQQYTNAQAQLGKNAGAGGGAGTRRRGAQIQWIGKGPGL